jgi:hypothetical protein
MILINTLTIILYYKINVRQILNFLINLFMISLYINKIQQDENLYIMMMIK